MLLIFLNVCSFLVLYKRAKKYIQNAMQTLLIDAKYSQYMDNLNNLGVIKFLLKEILKIHSIAAY